MTPVWDTFLTLLRASLGNGTGSTPELQPEQWQELFSLARAHKVLPLVFEPVHPLVQQADPALAAALKGEVRQQVIVQTLRTAEFLELYRALEEAAGQMEGGWGDD